MAKKKWLAVLLAMSLSTGTVFGAATVCEQATTVEAAQKLKKVYGEPWINSNVYGMAQKAKKPNIKDDFYLATQYKKFQETDLRPGHTSEGTLADVGEIVEERMSELMTDTSFTEDYAKQVQEYYQMFLDWDSRNAASRPYFDKHFGPIRAISNIDELTAYLKSEESCLYGSSLFFMNQDPDSQNPSVYTTNLYSTDLSLGDSAEYERKTSYGEMMEKANKEIVSYVLKYGGYSDVEVAQIIAENFAFEKELASSIIDTTRQNSGEAIKEMINPRTLEELRQESPIFPAADIIEADGFGGSQRINLREPEWLAKLNSLYTQDHFSQIKSYLLFHQAKDMITLLDEPAYREYRRIVNEINGLSESREDEYYAIRTVKSNLWNYVDQMYVKKYCSEKTKNDVLGLMKAVVSEYKKMLQKEKWLSASTRQKAIHKVESIKLYAAYPDVWPDWSSLTFATRANGGSYQDAMDAIYKFSHEKNINRVNAMVDPNMWDVSCSDVNASYWPEMNRILVYAGILNGDIYNENMTEEEKMGGIGVIIAHEISHAFDPTGSQYDERGGLSNWWKKADRKAFNKRAQKMIDYYDDIIPYRKGQHYNGELVQGEATADMGGVKCMLSIAKNKKGFNYKDFFEAYARVWFGVSTESYIEAVYIQDPHPMNYLRVNATLSQFEEFQKAYHIEEGDGMYLAPEDRVNIW